MDGRILLFFLFVFCFYMSCAYEAPKLKTEPIPKFPNLTGNFVHSPESYSLFFYDDFTESTLNLGVWWAQNDTEAYMGLQIPNLASSENVQLSDGFLHLINRQVNWVDSKGVKVNYSPGRAFSNQTFMFGVFSARLKIPVGAGWHSSFWLYTPKPVSSNLASEEIDILETDSYNPKIGQTNLHDWHLSNSTTEHIYGNVFSCANSSNLNSDLSADFHVFSAEWTEGRINFYCDGQFTGGISKVIEWNPVSIALTTLAESDIDDSALPSAAIFDWVAVYDLN